MPANKHMLYKELEQAHLEKGVGECQVPDASHLCIQRKLWVNIKEDWHVNLLARSEPLLLKAEALNFVEVLTSLLRSHIVCGDACHRLIAEIVSCVKGQGALPWRHLQVVCCIRQSLNLKR